MAKKTEDGTALGNWMAVDRALLDLGKAQIGRKALEAEMEKAVAQVQERFKARMERLTTEEAHVTGEIEQFVRANQAEMDGTFKGSFGKVQFRMNPRKVTLLRGKKEEKIVAALQEAGRDELLRATVVLNRQAILQGGTDEELEALGVRVTQTTTFKVSPDLKAIETAAATMDARRTA